MSAGTAGITQWQLNNNGTISQYNLTNDLLLGGTATISADFAFTGLSTATPIASISAIDNGGNKNGLVLSATNSTIQSLMGNTLTLGGSSTGNILLSPQNGAPGSQLTINAINTTLSANGSELAFSGTGVNAIGETGAGTLQINAHQLGGAENANSNNITNVNQLNTGANNLQLAGTTISTLGNNNSIFLTPNGTGDVGVNVSSGLLATLDVRANTGSTSVASISGKTAFSNLIVDQSGTGDLFSASKSGNPVFTLTNAGGVALFGNQGSSNQCLTSNGAGQAASWGTCGGAGLYNNYWQMPNSGAIAPFSTTADLLLGGTATTSAKFAFTGVDTATPVASISANPGSGTGFGLSFAGATSAIQSLNRNTLTIGGNTTGGFPFNWVLKLQVEVSILQVTEMLGLGQQHQVKNWR